MREAIFSLMAGGGGGNFAQDAIDPEANSIEFFVRLKMDIRGAIVDCIQQHFLDEFYDRGVINVLTSRFVSFSGGILVKKIEIDIVACEIFHRIGR